MVSEMLYPCIFCVALFVLYVACLKVFVNGLGVGGGALLDRPCMVFQSMCGVCI